MFRSQLSSNKQYISGPINVVRLEGSVNNIKKIIYLFMDWHQPTEYQTECHQPSKYITDYLKDNFSKLSNQDITLDFFLEIIPSYLMKKKISLPDIYIFDIINFFRNNFNYDSNIDKVSISDKFSNIRFHYVDIRDYYLNDIYQSFSDLSSFIDNKFNNYNLQKDDLGYIKKILIENKLKLKFFYNKFYPKKKSMERNIAVIPKKELYLYSNKEIETVTNKLINKIINKYSNKNIKVLINKLVDSDLKNYFDEIFNRTDQLITYIDSTLEKNLFIDFNTLNIPDDDLSIFEFSNRIGYGGYLNDIREILCKLSIEIDELFRINVTLASKIIDYFFLRRFLDKDYITNAIIYSGIVHSCNYIFILVKYFGFKVTDASYSKESVDKINKIIKSSSNFEYITPLFYPPKLYQCSNLSDFPKEFK
ncbi:Hypothetical protein KVN_LOCUS508 [uncultured virus]|nr:Hypothetical protein KVN_LOCUS508 [uncultured virus]